MRTQNAVGGWGDTTMLTLQKVYRRTTHKMMVLVDEVDLIDAIGGSRDTSSVGELRTYFGSGNRSSVWETYALQI